MKNGVLLIVIPASIISSVICFRSLLTVPQQGPLLITTEFGRMKVDPNEICVIQVGVTCLSGQALGDGCTVSCCLIREGQNIWGSFCCLND